MDNKRNNIQQACRQMLFWKIFIKIVLNGLVNIHQITLETDQAFAGNADNE